MRRAVAYYRREAGAEVAARLVRQFKRAESTLKAEPGIGSPQIGDELGIAGLRAWLLTDFPLSFWYVEREDHVDVVRLVGHRQAREGIDLAP